MVSSLIGSQSCAPPVLAFNTPGVTGRAEGLGSEWMQPFFFFFLKEDE